MNCDQLTQAREILNLSPTQMAKALGISYDTYKDWQSGRRKPPAVAIRCVQLLLAIQGTHIGKKFGL